ncbi:TetR/AcrR family transcriptional regulator [Actinomadura luteofluorescens]|uniref:TetR/AcrR family transcriptional regulator n=1 Tax=Actinomadura luteofluorescens TaxID=46163 RepID=UPI00362F3166
MKNALLSEAFGRTVLSMPHAHEASDGDGGRIPERVLTTAARLFSELGYDEASTQIIADACGIEQSVVTDRYGGKFGLYKAVLRSLTELRIESMKGALKEFTPDAAGLIRLIDSYLDFCLQYPEFPALWMHRWMSDATDIPEEVRDSLRELDQIVGRIAEAVAEDVDPEMFNWNVVWVINSFVRGGITGVDGVSHRADDPDTLLRFRRHLRQTARWAAGPPLPTGGASRSPYR